jgi:hypothetical protein
MNLCIEELKPYVSGIRTLPWCRGVPVFSGSGRDISVFRAIGLEYVVGATIAGPIA